MARSRSANMSDCERPACSRRLTPETPVCLFVVVVVAILYLIVVRVVDSLSFISVGY